MTASAAAYIRHLILIPKQLTAASGWVGCYGHTPQVDVVLRTLPIRPPIFKE